MYQVMGNDTITVGALGVRFLVQAADSNGTASVFECYVPAKSRMPAPHSHDGFEETVYGVEGISTWTIDGETVEVGPGEAVCVRRGQVHGFQNHGDVDATFLAIASPAVFGPAYFHDWRDPRRRCRRPAGPGRARRGHAPPRPYARAAQHGLTAATPLPSPDRTGRRCHFRS
jgi:quercetin dioxygenase-like cupin family protein